MANSIDIPTELITPELLARYDKPGPRYTSYPTAVEFNDSFKPQDYRRHLQEADKEADKPLSLYVHIPFCRSRCNFCGCNTIVCSDSDTSDRYLAHLFEEVDMLLLELRNRRTVVQYHWGGGTPTFLNDEQIQSLAKKIGDNFEFSADNETAIEVNPAVTTLEKISLLRTLGFNRLSAGVQDFNEEVLEAIGRNQSKEDTIRLIEHARTEGFQSVNMDLIYGLPYQTLESFDKTLDEVIEVAPDRVALYSFAYIPWIRDNQKRIDEKALPGRETKFALFAQALKKFGEAGYLQIGMDHFAKADDEMGKAAADGSLYRNFMGYTVNRHRDMIGLGASSIGFMAGAFCQNVKTNDEYTRAIGRGNFPIEKGYVLNDDDTIRQHVITELMCNFKVRFKDIEAKFNIDFEDYFKDELAAMAKQREDDHPFTEQRDDQIEVTPIGRVFVRNVCMDFDTYLKKKKGERPMFSRTI